MNTQHTAGSSFLRRWTFVAAFGASLLNSGTAWADGLDLKPSEIRGQSSKKPVSVLQNRFFLKSYRPEIGVLAGSMLNESYTDTKSYGLRAGLFFSEWVGVEIQTLRTSVSDTADRRALNKLRYRPIDSGDATRNGEEITVSPDPEVNAIHGITDLTAIAAPFYGKLNLMNKLIVYSDLYLSGGFSRVETDQGTKNAVAVGIGQRFYLYEAWSVRIDFRDRIYSETRAEQEARKHGMGFDIGASYFFL